MEPSSDFGHETATSAVLLIEANEEIARIIMGELKSLDVEVVWSASHLKALSILEDRKDIDVVLVMAEPTDIGGFDFIHLLRHRNRFDSQCMQIVVIAAPEIFEKFPLDGCGFDDYLLRPYFPGELSWRVHKAVQTARSKRRQYSKHQLDQASGIYLPTGVYRVLYDELNKIFRKNGILALVLISIQNLQAISVNHGHMMAEWMERDLSMAIRNSLRSYDHLGRLDNGYYCLIAPDVDAANLRFLVERLRQRVNSWNVDVARHSQIQIPIVLALHAVTVFPDCRPHNMEAAFQILWNWIHHECMEVVSAPGQFVEVRLTEKRVETMDRKD